jgi:hypothetical protein
MIPITDALDDPNLFGRWFSGPSWATWKAVLKAAFCIPMTPDELTLFRGVAQRDPPKHRVRELWAVVGRRGGKDSVASAHRWLRRWLHRLPPCVASRRGGERHVSSC